MIKHTQHLNLMLTMQDRGYKQAIEDIIKLIDKKEFHLYGSGIIDTLISSLKNDIIKLQKKEVS